MAAPKLITQDDCTSQRSTHSGRHRPIYAEWLKIVSVRSTWVLLSASLVIMVGMTLLSASSFMIAEGSGVQVDPEYVLQLPGSSIAFGGLMVSAFGVLAATSEWSTGTIVPTIRFSRNWASVVGAKCLVVASLTFFMAAITMLVSYLAVQPVLQRESLEYSITSEGSTGHMIGACLYLVLFSLISLGVGMLLRNTTASIVLMVALGFVLPAVLGSIELDVITELLRFSPSLAGSQMIAVNPSSQSLTQIEGGLVMTLWAFAALVGGTIAFVKRDA